MKKISLPSQWSLRAVSNFENLPPALRDLSIPAEVPGCVHLDLLRGDLIPDPYLDRNEALVQWIGLTDWEYTTHFSVEASDLETERLDLVCKGLDTVATLWINGEEAGRSENMHVEARFEIKHLLREGDNEIRVRFDSAVHYARAMQSRLGNLPTTYPDGEPYNFIRKNACNFGWDWGPTLITCGIWQAIGLEAWSGVRLKNVRPLVRVADSRVAVVEVVGELEHANPPANLDEIDPNLDAHTLYHMGLPTYYLAASLSLDEGDPVETTASFTALDSNFSTTLCVPNPELWWPTGYGEQPLYTLTLVVPDFDPGCGHDHGDLESEEGLEEEQQGQGSEDAEDEAEWDEESGPTIAVYEASIGLREVELDTTPDDAGAAWTLKVNGQKIWCKGANWIPDDVFLPRATDAGRLQTRIEQALGANMNMLRIWGGGIYESDEFYSICDQLGVLVWQDFLFACAAYSEEEPMRSLVEAEVRHNVARLSSHPSLVLWNGCNENIWGYFDWDWQEAVANRTWGAGYYFVDLPAWVSEVDPTRPYWPGSPYSGSMTIHPLADGYGNKHVWDTWNEVDYTHFRRYHPRFASEFGHQAPPSFSTLRRAIPEEARDPFSPAMLAHQKANGGNDKLHDRLKEHFLLPEGFDDWLYVTQLNQARAMQTAVEWFRSRPLCSGALYWQLNDCWPVTSWAAIDGDGVEKPLYWATAQFFRPSLLTIQPDGEELALWAHNDSDEVWSGTASVVLQTFEGQIQTEAAIDFLVAPRSLQKIARLGAFIPVDPGHQFLVAQTEDEDAFWYYAPDKELVYPEPAFVAEYEDGVLTVTAETFLRDLCIFADRLGARVDCGMVTLLPGESVEFEIYSEEKLTAEQLTSRPVLQCANWYGLRH